VHSQVAPHEERQPSAISAVQRTLMLRTFPAFAQLGPEDLALLAAIARERRFRAGEVMHAPGAPVMAFHMVVDGRVQMYVDGAPLRVLEGKSVVGGLAALTGDPRGAHAVALSDILALEFDTEDIQDVYEDNFSIVNGVIRGLSTALRSIQIDAGGAQARRASRKLGTISGGRSLTLVDKMFFLRKTTNFGESSIEALAELATSARECRFAAGELIWRCGADADYSLMICSGVVSCQPEKGDAFEYEGGWVVGGLDSLAHKPRWYDARAVSDVIALHMSRSSLFDVLEDHTDMALVLVRGLASGVQWMMEERAARQTP
jgi:CRP-like cAMP-binding protein